MDNIQQYAGGYKTLWFHAMATKLCTDARIQISKEEEKVKPGMTISA